MASTPASFCSQCGTPLQAGQSFCTNCGATIEQNANNPTLAASQMSFTPSASEGKPSPSAPPGSLYANSETSLPPPPPPPTYNPYTSNTVGPQSYAQTTVPNPPAGPGYAPNYTSATNPPAGGAYQVPAYAKPQGKRGCTTISIILLLILALGVGGYFLVHSLASKNTKSNTTGASSTPTSGTTTSQSYTPTAGSHVSSSEQLNLQVIYASINITLLSAQLASSFADDPSTTAGSAGIVRVNLRENNSTTSNPDYLEQEAMLLLLPGGTSTQLSYAQNSISPAQGVNRLNWIDFPLNAQAALNQLTLRIGKQSENQMDIPLQSQANISKYQDKSSNPNAQFNYGPLHMTLKSAILSYSYADQQATTGNLYAIVTLAASNTTTNSVDTYPSSYMRLQAGGNSIQPDNTTTFPYSVDANTSKSGVVAFLVPQGTATFTLVMLAQPSNSPAISQVTQNFQIP